MAKKSKSEKPEGYVFGRPPKYRKEFCEALVEYFDQPLYIEEEVEKMSASGAVKTVIEKRANDIPTLEGFAFEICKVAPETISVWGNTHPDFSKALKMAKAMQKRFLQVHATNGNYSASFSKFMAINNHGMRESSHVETENTHEVKGYGLAFDLTKKPDEL